MKIPFSSNVYRGVDEHHFLFLSENKGAEDNCDVGILGGKNAVAEGIIHENKKSTILLFWKNGTTPDDQSDSDSSDSSDDSSSDSSDSSDSDSSDEEMEHTSTNPIGKSPPR